MKTPQQELHDVIQKARQVFPDENIFYDLSCKETIPEFIANLRKRIKEAETQN